MSAFAPRYSERVLELFRTLPGVQPLAAGPGTAVVGEAVALDRGAWVRFEARVDRGRFADCAFKAWGCPHVLAACASSCLQLRDRPIDAVEAPDARGLARELAAPTEKLGRLLAVEDALQALLNAARAVQSG